MVTPRDFFTGIALAVLCAGMFAIPFAIGAEFVTSWVVILFWIVMYLFITMIAAAIVMSLVAAADAADELDEILNRVHSLEDDGVDWS